MTLRDLMSADVSLFMNASEFASAITYRAASGVETAITAVVYEAETQQDDNNGIITINRMRWVTFDAAYTQVDSTGLFVIDNKEWEVTPEQITDGIVTSVALKRIELYEHGRPNARRR